MSSARSRNSGRSSRKNEDEEIFVFGYACRVYEGDEHAERIAGEGHLIAWPADETALIDRYDCRLLLHSADGCSRENGSRGGKRNREDEGGMEEDEEVMSEKERWQDLHAAQRAESEREESEAASRGRGAEIGFSYDEEGVKPGRSLEVEESSESDDEPFQPPQGVKLPLGLDTPENQRQNHVIERTALFVVQRGPQMEIVIKAKQRNNSEQFGFLHFDHPLNAYYKYMCKLIREGKYTPNLEKKVKSASSTNGQRKTNALTVLAEESSDSDSDCELHPSLLAASRRDHSPDPVETDDDGFHGPKRKPVTPPPKVQRPDYQIETANDVYANLFKNLSQFRPESKRETSNSPAPSPAGAAPELATASAESEEPDPEYLAWFSSFYGAQPPLGVCSLPQVPPPPDLEPVLHSYAKYVAQHGARAEISLRGRRDLQLDFLHPSSPHFTYYHNAVRYAQWELGIQQNQREAEAAAAELAGVFEAPPPPLNRRQRRRGFHDGPCDGGAAPSPPSVVDPLTATQRAASVSTDEPATTSSPGDEFEDVVDQSSPSVASAFLVPPPVNPMSGITLMACPPVPKTLPQITVPPTVDCGSSLPVVNEVQLERKEKARLFMERILNEKKKKKAAEEAQVASSSSATLKEDGEIEEKDDKEKSRSRSDRRRRRREEEKEKSRSRVGTPSKGGTRAEGSRGEGSSSANPLSADFIDQLINSKINNLLESSGIKVEEQKKEEEKKEEKKRKKKKKRKSESRSRSRSRERKRRRRSRSRSRRR